MTEEQKTKLRVQKKINRALAEFTDESYIEPPQSVVHSNDYRKISRLQCDQGVIPFVLACNLSGGSVGEVDL